METDNATPFRAFSETSLMITETFQSTLLNILGRYDFITFIFKNTVAQRKLEQ